MDDVTEHKITQAGVAKDAVDAALATDNVSQHEAGLIAGLAREVSALDTPVERYAEAKTAPPSLVDKYQPLWEEWQAAGGIPEHVNPSERRGLRPGNDEDFQQTRRRAEAWGQRLDRTVYESYVDLGKDAAFELIEASRQLEQDRVREQHARFLGSVSHAKAQRAAAHDRLVAQGELTEAVQRKARLHRLYGAAAPTIREWKQVEARIADLKRRAG